jgi:desulfoferrodoxin (superoxide reductase-like protein)
MARFNVSDRAVLSTSLIGAGAAVLIVLMPIDRELTCRRQQDLRIQCGLYERTLLGEDVDVPAPSLWEVGVDVTHPRGDEHISLWLRSADGDKLFFTMAEREAAAEAMASFRAMVESDDPEGVWSVRRTAVHPGLGWGVLVVGAVCALVGLWTMVRARRQGRLLALLRAVIRDE